MELGVDPDTEIDPLLYVKCRLCIIETGSFRIHQIFQEQIKYCFDITVTHLDGLPQLICRKCKTTLSDYSNLKKTFIENQTILVQKFTESIAANSAKSKEIENKVSPHNDIDKPAIEENKTQTVRQDNSSTEEESECINRKKPKRRKNLILSTSSSSGNEESTSVPISPTPKEEAKTIQENIKDNSSLSWDHSFERKYVCRFCDLKFSSRELIDMHIKEHSKLMTIYKKCIKKHCKIMMERVELKPNVTGDTDSVVIAPDSIICDEGSVKYFIKYQPINYNNNNVSQKTYSNKRNRNSTSKRIIYNDSDDDGDFDGDDDDDDFKPVKKKKRVRSRSSSNDTVVLGGNNAKRSDDVIHKKRTKKRFESQDDSHEESICIDDSSNDSNAVAMPGGQQREHKMIQDITQGCYKKYLSGNKDGDKSNKDDDLLNKKLLSTGRKVLSTQGTTTNGLTKYLHHKHLHVCWVPVNKQLSIGNKTVYVRINTKLDAIENDDDSNGWSVIKKNKDFEKHLEAVETQEPVNPITDENNGDPPKEEVSNQAEINKEESVNSDVRNKPAGILPAANITVTDTPAKLTKNVNIDSSEILEPPVKSTEKKSDPVLYYENKLLNANPVANPKQLPKKNTFHDVKPNVTLLQAELEKDNSRPKPPVASTGESICVDSDEESSGMPMPIIMSTTSLAQNSPPAAGQLKSTESEKSCQSNEPTPESRKEKGNTEKAVPRIKCKPVAELMAPQNGVNDVASAVANKRQSHTEIQQETVQPGIYISPQGGAYIAPQLAVFPAPQQSLYIAPLAGPPAPSNSLNIEIDSGHITMNSVDLPNTLTKHPIEYFKTLLKMHGLVLVTTVNVALSKEFVCLVKFRLDVSQNEKSIILSLALFASRNVFCIKLRNSPSNDEMDIDKLPATWQLHVLKAFRGEVSEKILQFASKVSNIVSEHANTFVLLLKNIEYKSDVATVN